MIGHIFDFIDNWFSSIPNSNIQFIKLSPCFKTYPITREINRSIKAIHMCCRVILSPHFLRKPYVFLIKFLDNMFVKSNIDGQSILWTVKYVLVMAVRKNYHLRNRENAFWRDFFLTCNNVYIHI